VTDDRREHDRRELGRRKHERREEDRRERSPKAREVLYEAFGQGKVPTKEDFKNLIDSSVNIEDEGFRVSPENGVEIVLPEDGSSVVTFFLEKDPETPVWRIALDRKESRPRLHFQRLVDSAPGTDHDAHRNREEEPLLTLSPDGKIGVNNRHPARDLDVGGWIKASGRIGTVPKVREETYDDGTERPRVLADGEWHNITEKLYGCFAFEIVAGLAGRPRQGHYSLVRAIAMNTYDPRGWYFNFMRRKNKIRTHQAYYLRRDRLELRWHRQRSFERHECVLQIRSRREVTDDLRQPVPIDYHLTELWHNPEMSTKQPPDGGGGGAAWRWLPLFDHWRARLLELGGQRKLGPPAGPSNGEHRAMTEEKSTSAGMDDG